MQRGEKLSGRIVSNGIQLWFSKSVLTVGCAVLFAGLAILVIVVHSGRRVNAAAGISNGIEADRIWKVMSDTAQERQAGNLAIPAHARLWQLDDAALQGELDQALPDGMGALENSPAILSLPLPDGSEARFRIVDSPVLAPELAAQYPQIKSYRGQGVDNPSLTMRCSWTPSGLSALVIDGAQTVMIQPLAWFRQAPVRRNDSAQGSPSGGNAGVARETEYVSYYGQDYTRAAGEAMCLVKGDQLEALKLRQVKAGSRVRQSAENFSFGDALRTYRIAIATTAQYRSAVPGGNVLASINTWLSNTNAVLGKELAINLVLASPAIYNNSYIFTNGDAAAMLDQVRAALKSLDPSTYDLGHVLGTGSGGNAFVGVVCETLSDSTGPYKAAGVTLVSNAGTPGNTIDLIALMHELGHEFGATHTYNVKDENCSNGLGRTGDTAFELGSGMSIMSRGGSCGSDNIVSARSSFFHSGSLAQIIEFLDSFGGGCGAATQTSNAPPIANTGSDYIIPRQTSFTLSGTVSDPAGQALTYTWEQIDAGGSYANPPYGDQPSDLGETTRPLFLPMAPAGPVASGSTVTRTFSGGTPGEFLMAESLPTIGRPLNFRLTARDNQSAGGGVGSATVRVGVAGNAGPFRVTFPNGGETLPATGQVTVQWDVAYTGPGTSVNCSNVKISLSTDGGLTFPTVLASSVPNNGSALVALSGGTITAGRIKIEAVGNLFFDVSNANFVTTQNSCSFSINLMGQAFAAGSGSGAFSLTAGAGCQWLAVSSNDWLNITSGTSGTGNGTINFSVAANTGVTRRGTIRVGSQTFTVTQAGPVSGNGLMFYPLARPIRLLETRPDSGFPLQGCYRPNAPITGGTARTQPARGTCDGLTIPNNAAAITGNITVVNNAAGSLTLYASDISKPNTENSNYNTNEITNNVFTVALGASDGAFKIHPSATTDVIVDVTGYYAPPDVGGLYFHPLPQPIRLLETRADFSGFPLQGCYRPNAQLIGTYNPNSDPNLDRIQQGQSPLTCVMTMPAEVPASAQLLIGNATSVFPQGLGWLTIYPSDASRSLIASSNYAGSDVINGPFTVKLGADGKFKIYTYATTNVVVDILGYFSTEAFDVNGTGLLFNPLSKPVRLLETRNNTSLPGCYKPNAPIASGDSGVRTQSVWGSCEGVTIANTALAIVGNATVTNQAAAGYMTLWPGNIESPPLIATSNYPVSSPNGYNRHFFVGLSPSTGPNAGAFKILSQFAADLRVDVSGYFAP